MDTQKKPEQSELAEIQDDLETLAVLEQVAEARQKQVEAKIEAAVSSGVTQEEIRSGLQLSEPTIERMLDADPPELHERLGISEGSAEALKERATLKDDED